MQGIIFDIKRYAIHDGPGIRTTFFFKGCGLHCHWCHNPESQLPGKILARKILRVGQLEHAEEQEIGRAVTVGEIVAAAERDLLCYEESGGGVTFSGGEPLLQPAFLASCLEACKGRHLHTCVDTAGAARAGNLDEICRWTDLFLYDVKTMNPRKFKHFAGDGFHLVRENLERVARAGKEMIIRVPVIPGFNMEREDAREIIAFLDGLPAPRRVQLLPYHRHGVDKYARLGREYKMGDAAAPGAGEIMAITRQFQEAGYETL
ncbi:MAG: glycyl-radical enzyme activating protein [Odoribacteraceae bacterium]|jgi:pyruvate formate lyase activating enzyme|nr:glycyl-radical enzyme activating protein [Odoribacteraceae bacterium]